MKTVEIVLFDNASGLDITGALEVFSIATKLFENKGVTNKGYQITFSANKIGLVTLHSGLKSQPEKVLDKDASTDMFLIPGGLGVNKVCETPEFINLIKQRADRSKKIISICTGTFVLAEAGMLQGKT